MNVGSETSYDEATWFEKVYSMSEVSSSYHFSFLEKTGGPE